MDLTNVKQDNPSWWIYAFQNKGEITCIVHNGLNKYGRDKLIEKHGKFYEIFGDYPSKYSAEKAALEIEKQESLDPIFYPNKDTEKAFQTQLNNLNKDNSTIINMGKLPPIYSALGIKDKELKTNVKAILKSQGFEGHNRHQIPKEIINNLLPLVYNPKAVFKSLLNSDNPDAFIAVLDAKTAKQEQIIAILSPSKDGQGFTFIPSVYEKHNFERFLERTHEEEKVLYVASKWKGSEIWGTLQSRPRHNSEPYINNIKDYGDIVKHFSQDNQIKKENNMADYSDQKVQFEWEKTSHYEIPKSEIELISTEHIKFASDVYCIGAKKENDNESSISIYHEPEAFSYDYPDNYYHFDVGIETMKKLVEDTLTNLNNDFPNQSIGFVSLCEYLDKNINENKIEQINKFINEKSELQENGTLKISSENWKQLNNNKPFAEGFLDKYAKEVKEEQSLKSPAQADENIISKENSMSDVNEQEGNARDPKEEAFLATVHQRKVITEAMKAGNLCCLPGAEGYADTKPAVNLINGTYYHGANMMFLKEHARKNGYPSAEYLTFDQVQKARVSNPDIVIRQGQKGVSIYVSEKNEETNQWEDKSIRLFNVAQTSKPAEVKAFAVEVQQQKLKEKEAYLQTQYGTGFTLDKKEKQSGPDIICSSTNPVQYIGQYLAAVSIGSKFQVTKEQAAEFSKNLESALYAKMDNGHTNPFLLSKISNDASIVCKEVIKEAKIATQKLEQPQQEQEQTQSRGHKM